MDHDQQRAVAVDRHLLHLTPVRLQPSHAAPAVVHRLPGFVAALAMHSMDETMDELHRAVRDLGAVGAQIFTNVGGRPLDHPDFEPVFAAMADYDLPIWMHPARTSDMTDYAAEEKSRFEIWWALGWPYETSVAMVRLVGREIENVACSQG